MTWHGYATIGFNADGAFSTNYPLSGTSSVTEVACLQYPDSVWSNLVYALTPHSGICTYMYVCCSQTMQGAKFLCHKRVVKKLGMKLDHRYVFRA